MTILAVLSVQTLRAQQTPIFTTRRRESCSIPVHIQYWTAWVDSGGLLNFRKDINSRDKLLTDALIEPPPA